MTTDIIPRDLNLPPRFSAWRPGQLPALYRTIESPQRFIAQCAPTGFGKSMFGIAAHKLFATRTCVITSTKVLADQYQGDFHTCGMADIRGRHNYRCPIGTSTTCGDGRILGCKSPSCPRNAALSAAKDSDLVVTNYACYLHSYANGEGLGEFGLLILDEAHSIIDELCSFLEIRFDHAEYEFLYTILATPPPHGQSVLAWRKWASHTAPLARKHLDTLKKSNASSAQIKLTDRLSSDLDRLTRISDEWILDENPGVIAVFSPLWPTAHAESLLFRGVPKILFLSATIVPKTTSILGVPDADLLFLENPPVFNPSRCPIYLFGSSRIDYRSTEGQKAEWVARMDYLINQRLDRKALIHTFSYAWQQEIVSRSQHSHYMLAPQTKTLASAVSAFRQSPPPKLIASPALTTGYDFPLRDAEYQFLMKVPFIDARTKIMKARTASDPEYLPHLTAQTITQTCGRIMRQPDDQGETFIMDAHANWFVRKHRALFPSEFLNRVRYADGPPKPPRALPSRVTD
jgi:Rad3-related DNA helicase